MAEQVSASSSFMETDVLENLGISLTKKQHS